MTLTLVKPLTPRITMCINNLDGYDARLLQDLFCLQALLSGAWEDNSHTASVQSEKTQHVPSWLGVWARYIPGATRTRFTTTMVVESDDEEIIAAFQTHFEQWMCRFHKHTTSIIND